MSGYDLRMAESIMQTIVKEKMSFNNFKTYIPEQYEIKCFIYLSAFNIEGYSHS